MKSKSLFPTHKPIVMLPLPQGPKHFYKCLTVVVVIGLHVFVVWMLSHLIEPYTFKATPKVDALKVSFVSLAPAKKPAVEKTESQPKNSVTPKSTLNSSVSHAPDQPKNSLTNVQTLASKTPSKKVMQNNLNDKQQAQPKTTLNNLASSQTAQRTERRMAHTDKKLSSSSFSCKMDIAHRLTAPIEFELDWKIHNNGHDSTVNFVGFKSGFTCSLHDPFIKTLNARTLT